MKRVLVLFLTIALLLSGCGISPAPVQTVSDPELISANALLDRLLSAVPEGSEHPEVVHSEELAACLLIYGIDPALVKDCAVSRLGGSQVFELAVIDLAARSTAAEEALLAYLLQRQGDFAGYAPDQAAIAEHGKLFAVEGDFRLVLAITEDTGAVADTLGSAGYTRVTQVESARVWEDTALLSPDPEPTTTTIEPTPEPSFRLPCGWHKYTPPNIDNMTIYDTSAIRAAWEAGSPEGLGHGDKKVYERCVEIINHRISDDMSDYEKEWAIYSWLVNNVEYDWRHQDSFQTTPRDSFHPYGALVNGTAVCLGYATTFQLFMDLLSIECITVVGAAFNSTEDHAWNMVKLNGEWYCVDATWDLGHGNSPNWCSYFNVTSDYMAQTDHQWDYENTPMATATDGGKN